MPFECSTSANLSPEEVALVVHHGDIGRHIGFAVFTAKGRHQFLHLAFHKKVILEDYPLSKCSIVGRLPFDKIGLMVLKKALWNIGKKVGHKSVAIDIPYGVNIANKKGTFTKEGLYKPPPDRDGLTCATFVAEICRGVGLQLLNEGDWAVRPEDAGWIDQICNMLADPRSGADEAHIAQVRRSFTGIRIRPEEVASAVTLWNSSPINFGPAEAEGRNIVTKLNECCPKLPTPTAGVDEAND